MDSMVRSSSERKPSWIKVKVPSGENYSKIKKMVTGLQLTTVCQEARCPNLAQCWGGGTATFMLLGEVCTRGCRFCHVKTGNPKGWVDPAEPDHVAKAISQMHLHLVRHLDRHLDYVVLTSVNRDDLVDQGADHFARTVVKIRQSHPKICVEVLTPDFRGERSCLERVVAAGPEVFAHNVETVERLTPKVRDRRATYRQSLEILRMAKEIDQAIFTKSSVMVGLGETDQEIRQVLQDLRQVGCDIVTLGQYLQPTRRHLPVEAFVTPERFRDWKDEANEMGFMAVASGPLVRSSYRAGEFFLEAIKKAGGV